MGIKKSYLVGFVISLILITYSMNATATVDTKNLAVPTYVDHQETFSAQDADENDIRIQGNPQTGLVSQDSKLMGASANLVQFNKRTRTNWGTVNKGDAGIIPTPGINSFTNTTNGPMSLEFSAQYYDLLNYQPIEYGNNSTKGIRQLALTAGRSYGFTFSVEDLTPQVFELFPDEVVGGVGVTVTFTILIPSGLIQASSFFLTRAMMNFIPFVPNEIGNYTALIRTNVDTVFSQISLDTNPKVVTIESGVSDKVKGRESEIKFYKLMIPGIGPKLADVRSIVFRTLHLGGLAYLGTAVLRIFGPSPQITNLWGTGLPNQLISDTYLYISVVLTPPDETNPSIKAEKDNAGLPAGMDLEYSIFAEFFDIPDLPINEDFNTNTHLPYSTTTQFYIFNTDEDVIVGVNSTSIINNQATFFPFDTNQTMTIVDHDVNNILNNLAHAVTVIKSGTYVVRFTINIQMRVSVFSINDGFEVMEPGSTSGSTQGYSLNSPMFYKLDTDQVMTEFLNITYLDKSGVSSDFEFTFYSAQGVLLAPFTTTLENFNNSGVIQFSNLTSISSGVMNIDGMYFRININANVQYDSNGALVSTNDDTIVSNLKITRMSLEDILQKNNPSGVYYQEMLEGTNTLQLNSFNATIQAFYTIKASENKMYRITIDSENRSLTTMMLNAFTAGLWEAQAVNFPVFIANISHYQATFDFASTMDMTLGLWIVLGFENQNGTLDVKIEELEYYTEPNLLLTSINTGGFRETQIARVEQPAIAAVVSIALIGTAVAVIIVRSRSAV